jgi:quinol monooxygenase YgiN
MNMASEEITEFCVLKFKDGGSEPPQGWEGVTGPLKAAEGCKAIYFGEQLEDPGTWVLVIQWTCQEAFRNFVGLPTFKPWFNTYQALIAKESMSQATLTHDATAALSAPCTEVVTAYDIEPVFMDNTQLFVERIEGKLPGCHGCAYGQVSFAKGDEENSAVAKLIIGWDSKEVHLAAKGVAGRKL